MVACLGAPAAATAESSLELEESALDRRAQVFDGEGRAVGRGSVATRVRPRLFELRFGRQPSPQAATEIRGEYALSGALSWVPRGIRPRLVYRYADEGPDAWLGEVLAWDRALRLLREEFLERETGIEPATPSLGSSCSAC